MEDIRLEAVEKLRAERNRPNKNAKMTKALKDFLLDLLLENQDVYIETFEELRQKDKRRWLEHYIDMAKLVMPKQNELNVTVDFQKDMQDLHILAASASRPTLPSSSSSVIKLSEQDFKELPQ